MTVAPAVLQRVRSFVSDALQRDLGDDDNYFEKRFVGSMFGMRLIAFIEKAFAVEILDNDLEVENFNSITNVSAFVTKKLS